jgi:aspartate/methionine/tyrosine aminotransferase
VLLELLDDPTTVASLTAARHEYSRRRRDVVERLAAVGVTTTGTDGINLWVEVADERAALLALAARGIGAAPGQPFAVSEGRPTIRVTVGLLGDDGRRAEVTEALAVAANTSATSRRGQR